MTSDHCASPTFHKTTIERPTEMTLRKIETGDPASFDRLRPPKAKPYRQSSAAAKRRKRAKASRKRNR